MARDGERGWSAGLDHLIAVFVLCSCLWVFSAPLRSGRELLPYAQDDFYYYLAGARNLAHGRGSTFDGRTLTNGYHPLYFALLVGVSSITGNLRGVFRFLFTLDVCSGIAIFLLIRKLTYRVLPDRLIANGIAGMIFYLSVLMISQQMEVTLTLPLGFLFLWLLSSPARSPAHLFLLGGVAALMVLSRLDSVLMVLLAGAVLLCDRKERDAWGGKGLLCFTVAFLLPMLTYVAINLHFFGRIAPISGAAKQLQPYHAIHLLHAIKVAAGRTRLMFAISLAAALTVPMLWRHLSGWQKAVSVAGTLFPFLHWGIVLYLSDWPLWGWYSYSLRFSLAVALVLAGVGVYRISELKVRRAGAALICFVGLGSVAMSRYRVDPEMVSIATDALAIRDFTATHPGRYAMGDRAGMVGYVDGQPTLQLEGLMEDDAFLRHIQRQDSLPTVFSDYGVDYYIAFTRDAPGDCFHAVEPAKAGPDSPVMRGEFCGGRVAVFQGSSGTTSIYAVAKNRH